MKFAIIISLILAITVAAASLRADTPVRQASVGECLVSNLRGGGQLDDDNNNDDDFVAMKLNLRRNHHVLRTATSVSALPRRGVSSDTHLRGQPGPIQVLPLPRHEQTFLRTTG